MTDETKQELERIEKAMVASERVVKAAEAFTRAIDRACRAGVEVEMFTVRQENETDSVNFYTAGFRQVAIRTLVAVDSAATDYYEEDEDSEDE